MIEEESWSEEPLIHAQRALELSELQNEIARLRPQMELAAERSREAAEQLRKELCPVRREILQQSAQQKKQLEKDLQNLRMRLLRLRDEWI
jgi:hypothetical protein